ncbi:MAG: alkyl hydroperoxide reductase subunit F [Lactiplantibacillus plantarum]|jgi:alkyl hydroperoxide reductase subunit F|nr:alkyl hydroperoxide reductase subunit F [Lactiplantibacillus plantarum]
MAIDATVKQQLVGYLKLLEHDVVITTDLGTDQRSQKVSDFVNEVAALTPRITVVSGKLKRQPSFALDQAGQASSGIEFAGVPLGHEFTSFVLALLQVSGHAPKISAATKQRITAINTDLHFETFASLSCHNCPDVVQALNIMSVLNPHVSHTMIEGGMYQDEATEKNILAVPTVFLNGEEWHNGRATLEELVDKAAGAAPQHVASDWTDQQFDVVIVGAGPAAGSAAIYAARKGISTAIVADHFGGQPLDTLGIENLAGTDYVEGEQLMANIQAQVEKYGVKVLTGQRVEQIVKNDVVELTLAAGDVLKAKTAIIATGAQWKTIGVPGEAEFKNKGVAYCPHCDGPLYAGKEVAVIGGGNSGIEAAIDLAGICQHVTVLEFAPELGADSVLQAKANAATNITLLTNAATKEITGAGRVNGLTYTDRATQTEHHLDLEGVFVQIGLVPNTDWVTAPIEVNAHHEIVTDARQATNVDGIFAAGDCTDSAYKQIIIAMGAGATAALSAFDYLVRTSVKAEKVLA